MGASTTSLRKQLREQFGYDAFRPGQERILSAILDGRDVLGVLPTGSGKSLTFQLASQRLPGATIIVSPLIALMKDQVESAEANGMEASLVNSTQTDQQSQAAMAGVEAGESKLLYVTPERFENEAFMEELEGMDVSLFVVDEAHCISEWGHNFRPAYLTLGGVIERLGHPTLLALTATATPWVRDDIISHLGMRDPSIVVRGFDRPNLFFEVRRVEEEYEDRRVLEELFTGAANGYPDEIASQVTGAMQGSGIIYTATTAAAEETVEWLAEWGVDADFYHGQRRKADRERVQDAFMNGEVRVMVATNAFGMGVDKPDVRFVIHRDIPPSIESYYQEAGRAGRDGNFALCSMIYRTADLGRAAFMSGTGEVTRAEVEAAHDALAEQPEATLEKLQEATGLGKSHLVRLIMILEQDGIVREDDGQIEMVVDDFDPTDISLQREEARKAYERSRLDMMRGYAETQDCRRAYILNYFGEEYEDNCAMCDNDVLGRTPEPAAAADSPFAIGDRVVHESLGEGTVQRLAGGKLTILFEDSGYRTLSLEAIEERGLLRRADQ
jgi:ATP-dependent DNA helicase RecQ